MKKKCRKAGSVRADRQNRGNEVVHENGLDPSDSAVVRCFFLEIIPPIFCMEPFLFSKSFMKIRHPLDLTIKAIRVLRGRDRWAVNKGPPLIYCHGCRWSGQSGIDGGVLQLVARARPSGGEGDHPLSTTHRSRPGPSQPSCR